MASAPLEGYVPALAREWLAHAPNEPHRQIVGTALYADVAGFTKLSERLVRRGRVGAEEVVGVLDNLLRQMVEVAATRGGQLLEFGGDSMLFFFPEPPERTPHHLDDDAGADDAGADDAAQACAAATEVHALLRALSAEPTAVGRVALRASVGIHRAPFDFFLIGGSPTGAAPGRATGTAPTQRQLAGVGPAFDRLLDLERCAPAGGTLVSTSVADLLSPAATRPIDDTTDDDTTVDGVLLRWRNARRVPKGARVPTRALSTAMDLLPERFVAAMSGGPLAAAHQTATVVFVRLSGASDRMLEIGPAAFGAELDGALGKVLTAFADEGVCVLSVNVAVNGLTVFACSGAPATSEDDEGRGLRAALIACSASASGSTSVDVSAGVHRGHVFAASLGNGERMVYSAMGDTTNTAARICAAAAAGGVLAHPDVLAHARRRYSTRAMEPVVLKGKARPLALYVVEAQTEDSNRTIDIDAPLVGRASELAVLDRVLQRKGGLVVVGEAGVGKTRLLNEALHGRGGQALVRFQAEPGDLGTPGAVARRGLRTFFGLRDLEVRDDSDGHVEPLRSRLLQLLERHLPEDRALWPLLATVLDIPLPPTAESEALLPSYRSDAAGRLLVSLLRSAVGGALVISVEDGQWVDTASSLLLSSLNGAAKANGWPVLVTRREGGRGERTAGFDPESLERLVLHPLTRSDATQLVRSVSEATPLRQSQIDQMLAVAAGNPLHLSELVTNARSGGLDGSPTSTLRGAIRSRLQDLDSPTRHVLEVASVLGVLFDQSTLDGVLSRTGMRVDKATERSVAGFLRPLPESSALAFQHALVREVLYESLSFRRRRALHLDAAKLIEAQTAHTSRDVALLAYHFSEARHDDEAVGYAVQAAAHAEATQSPLEAVEQLQRAIEISSRVSSSASVDRRDLWLRLADAWNQSAVFDQALAATARAGRLSRPGAERAEVELRRARLRERSGHFRAALAANTRVRRHLGALSKLESMRFVARADAQAAICYQLQGRQRQALVAARSAMEAAEACDERRALAQACGVLARGSLMTGQDDGRALGMKALRLFQDVGDAVGESRMLNNLGIEAFYRNDWNEAVRWYESCAAIGERTGAVTDAALSRLNAAEVLVNQGRTTEAEAIVVAARQEVVAAGHWAVPLVELHLGRLRLQQGALDEAEVLLGRSVEQSLSMEASLGAYEAAVSLAACLVLLDRSDEVAPLINERWAAAEPSQRPLLDGIKALVEAAALIRLEDRSAAQATVDRGVELSRSRGQEYDLARLLDFAVRHGLEVPEGASEEAQRLLTGLGVVQVLQL